MATSLAMKPVSAIARCSTTREAGDLSGSWRDGLSTGRNPIRRAPSRTTWRLIRAQTASNDRPSVPRTERAGIAPLTVIPAGV